MAKVKDDIEYSNHLIKVHNVMNVLDLPNNQEEAFREILTKQDNKTLEELARKSKQDIQSFLINEKKNLNTEKNLTLTNNRKITLQKENEIINIEKNKSIENQKNDQDIQKIKSVFTPQILEQNPNIADKLNSLD